MKKFLALMIMIMLWLSSAHAANIDTQIRTQQRTQSNMRKKIQQYNEIAKKKSQQSKTLLSQLSRLRQNANDSQNQIQGLERENQRLESSVNELNQSIAEVSKSVNEILNVLRGRVIDLYKFTPQENGLNLILNSDGPHDAVVMAYMLRRFVRQDQAMIEELISKEEELTRAKNQLVENQSQIQKQTEELRKRRAEFDSTIKKTDTLLKNVQSEQKRAEAAAKELENAQRAVGSKINALMRQKRASTTRSTPAKTTTTPAKPGNTTTTRPSTTTTTSLTPPKTLAWPLNGTVTMQYGSRVHPTFKTKIFNSGIDIKAAAGTPVKAAGAGEVLYQGWLRGFGQVVIIDHGGDLTTVYAHLGGTSVREGSVVKTGTVIGRVGNTGTDSEYGLHFEVRRNGTAQNPMNFLRR